MTKLPLNPYKSFEDLNNSLAALYNNEVGHQKDNVLDKTLYDLLVANFNIWKYEDGVRRADVPDKEIAALKRNIDKENQRRNDLIDKTDAILKQDIEKQIEQINSSLPLNSETPGSILDRLIILALRDYNLKKELERKNIDESHKQRCSNMLKEVKERTQDLLKCLEELLEDYYSGKKRIKAYKQHKLYNDPDLNPSLRLPRS